MTSVFYSALDAVKDALIALDLDGLDSSLIKVRRLPHDGEVYHPGITVHPVTETVAAGTNMREDVGYGCALTLVRNNNNNSLLSMDRVLQWRETIRQYFVENPTVGTAASIFRVMVEQGEVFSWDDLTKTNYDVSRIVLRVWSRESRS